MPARNQAALAPDSGNRKRAGEAPGPAPAVCLRGAAFAPVLGEAFLALFLGVASTVLLFLAGIIAVNFLY